LDDVSFGQDAVHRLRVVRNDQDADPLLCEASNGLADGGVCARGDDVCAFVRKIAETYIVFLPCCSTASLQHNGAPTYVRGPGAGQPVEIRRIVGPCTPLKPWPGGNRIYRCTAKPRDGVAGTARGVSN
jgi:hypothetical protein